MIKSPIPLLLAVVIAACSCSTSSDESSPEGSPSSPEATDAPLPPIPGAEDQTGKHATLTQGTITALGLVIPDGMTPGPAPRKVYRFEGNFPVFQVATFIHQQVTGADIEIEDGGYLMQKARVRTPKGSATGKEILDIRVFKGRRKGATIDIWLERYYVKKPPSKNLAPPKPRTRSQMSPAEKQRRSKEHGETMRVMRKVTSGEPLDEKDRNSPFFD
ncbi:MAG: hypothetical protein GY762_10150 [Proteobacteria bacterium]|nr:hypothetical protein [Pseudomonadota bacterium]